jgi:hypothetical protein
MNNPNQPPVPLTYESLMASIYENDRLIKEKQAETDRQMKEYNRDIWKKFAETDRLIKANSREIGGISKSNGDVAEEYFYRSFKKYPHFAGQNYSLVEANKSCSSKELNLDAEYDLVLYNGVSIVIIEIKYKAKKEDVEDVLNKANTFKKLFPKYKDYTFYLGIAGLKVNKDTEKEAIKQGIAVIKQDGRKVVINDRHLKEF